eukprot:TRINITY_DN30194_c0_g1_i2.p3 TRINITY_DN30194_c0_g1~~TRINITY_DN30194_c0_g1_i2.p3  ORF type:complete len:170 (+),score=22.90 TRINITY_DN30194_c0_g1_i2:124-633(+)
MDVTDRVAPGVENRGEFLDDLVGLRIPLGIGRVQATNLFIEPFQRLLGGCRLLELEQEQAHTVDHLVARIRRLVLINNHVAPVEDRKKPIRVARVFHKRRRERALARDVVGQQGVHDTEGVLRLAHLAAADDALAHHDADANEQCDDENDHKQFDEGERAPHGLASREP